MAAESKSFIPRITSDRNLRSRQALTADGSTRTRTVDRWAWFEVGLVFALIMMAVWTPQGHASTSSSVLAALCLVWLTVRRRYSAGELGLTRPGSGTVVMLVSGGFMVATIVVAGSLIHRLGPAQPVPWPRAWHYAIWAFEQEFILQSFFYVRLESLLGGRRAVMAAACLFAAAHVPSPALTLLSFIGGLIFCDMFRRYRNIFPLGLVQATLGLAIAVSLPDRLLHHMRVGIGYISYRP